MSIFHVEHGFLATKSTGSLQHTAKLQHHIAFIFDGKWQPTNHLWLLFWNETSNHPKSPTVSLGIQKMAMFAQTQEPPFDDDLPTSVHTAGVDRGEVAHSLQKHKM